MHIMNQILMQCIQQLFTTVVFTIKVVEWSNTQDKVKKWYLADHLQHHNEGIQVKILKYLL